MKPAPDMNTQLLMDIQEQLNQLRLIMQDMKMEFKTEVRGCKRSLDLCKIAFDECKKGYHDIVRGYKECSKGFEAVKEQCEDLEESIMKI